MKRLLSILAFILITGGVAPATEVGKTCYSKQASTALLAEANRTAATVGTVPWGRPLKVIAVNGRWLGVSHGKLKGWVYSGNVSSKKPPSENKNDMLPTTAADTSAAVAARPLSTSSRKYASRKSLGSAAADIEWMEQQADAVTRSQVDAYMSANQLGDY